MIAMSDDDLAGGFFGDLALPIRCSRVGDVLFQARWNASRAVSCRIRFAAP